MVYVLAHVFVGRPGPIFWEPREAGMRLESKSRLAQTA